MQTIIYFTSNNIDVYRVDSKGKKSPGKVFSSQYINEDLDVVLLELRKKIGDEKVKILLSDDFSYSFEYETDENEINRNSVEEVVKVRIPEVLDGLEWDYKELPGEKGKKKKIVVFAPVKSVWEEISKSLEKAKILVQGVEPEYVAKKRDENPLIGMAKKVDFKGKDEEVLNVLPLNYNEFEKKQVVRLSVIRSFGLVILSALVTFLIAYFIVIKEGKGLSLYFTLIKPKNSNPVPTVPEFSPTPTLGIDLLKVQILNGTGRSGEADESAKKLKLIRINTIEIGNADNYEYNQTIIQFNNNINPVYKSEIENELKNIYTDVVSTPLLETSKFDIVIILGGKKL